MNEELKINKVDPKNNRNNYEIAIEDKNQIKEPLAEEFFCYVRRCGSSGHIQMSKKWVGKRVKIIVQEEES